MPNLPLYYPAGTYCSEDVFPCPCCSGKRADFQALLFNNAGTCLWNDSGRSSIVSCIQMGGLACDPSWNELHCLAPTMGNGLRGGTKVLLTPTLLLNKCGTVKRTVHLTCWLSAEDAGMMLRRAAAALFLHLGSERETEKETACNSSLYAQLHGQLL